MRVEIIFGIFMIIVLLISGCDMTSQRTIINECLKDNSSKCSEEECMVERLIGYTGLQEARINYFQCKYIEELTHKRE